MSEFAKILGIAIRNEFKYIICTVVQFIRFSLTLKIKDIYRFNEQASIRNASIIKTTNQANSNKNK